MTFENIRLDECEGKDLDIALSDVEDEVYVEGSRADLFKKRL